MTSKCGKNKDGAHEVNRVYTELCFNHILEYSMIHYCTDPWQHVIHVSVLRLQIEIIGNNQSKMHVYLCAYDYIISNSIMLEMLHTRISTLFIRRRPRVWVNYNKNFSHSAYIIKVEFSLKNHDNLNLQIELFLKTNSL